jgi:ABC-type uncharacterized transport system auxiliary subunit
MNKITLKLTITTLMGFFIIGCSPLAPITVPTIKTYTLNTEITTPQSNIKTNKSITVMPVIATRGFNSDAMIYQSSPYLLSHFAETAWIAPPATMMTTLLVQTLQQSNAFTAVVTGPAISNTDYMLNTNLISFYQDFTVHPSQIVLKFDVDLINSRKNQVVFDSVFSARVNTLHDTPYGGVIATNTALDEILPKIAQALITATAGS